MALALTQTTRHKQDSRRIRSLLSPTRINNARPHSFTPHPSSPAPSLPPHFHSLCAPPPSPPPRPSSHLSLRPAPLHARQVNSDHVWHFISYLHFSPPLRLMGCLAINEYAKTGIGPRSGKGYIDTNTHMHMDAHTQHTY